MYDWIGKITENHLLIQKMAAWSRWIPKSCMLMLLGCAAAILQLSVFSKGMGIKVEANLSTLLKDRSAEELTRIRHQFFRNLVITLYEIIVESKYLEGSESWRLKRHSSLAEVLSSTLHMRGTFFITTGTSVKSITVSR
jgi:lauroyl/myristoyl acyltransferase